MSKQFISASSLASMSYHLGALVYNGGFYPDFMITLWRGGATIGLHVHELFKFMNVAIDHIAVRTSSYKGVNTVGASTASGVNVHTLNYVTKQLKKGSKILLVDDVYESGNSVSAVIEKLTKESGIPLDQLDIRVATVFYKPKKNRSYRKPDYYVSESDDWLVFPHEVEGLTLDEIKIAKGDHVFEIFSSLKKQ